MAKADVRCSHNSVGLTSADNGVHSQIIQQGVITASGRGLNVEMGPEKATWGIIGNWELRRILCSVVSDASYSFTQ